MPGCRLHQLCAPRVPDRYRDDLQGHLRSREQQLRLRGTCRRRGREPRRVLEHAGRDDTGGAGYDAALGAGDADGNAVSAGEIDLSWGVATDNVGVSGYQIYRCQGAGCTTFALLASPAGTRRPYKDHESPRRRPIATRCEPRMLPATSGRSRTSSRRRRRRRPTRRRPRRRGRWRPTPSAPARSTSPGAPPPTTSASRVMSVPLLGLRVRRVREGRADERWNDDLQRHRPDGGDELQLRGPRSRRGRQHRPLLERHLGHDVSDEFRWARRRIRLQRRNRHDGRRRLRQRQRRHVSNTTWAAAGKYGGALSFNGTNARVNIPNSASLQLNNGMTLEAWVNPVDDEQHLARRHLQSERQLLPRGDLRQQREAGGRWHVRRW